MAIALLDRRPARGAHVREQQGCADLCGDLAQVLIVPGGMGALEHRGRSAVVVAVPPDAEAVPVRGHPPELSVQTLVDDRVLRPDQQIFSQDRLPGVGHPPAHHYPPCCWNVSTQDGMNHPAAAGAPPDGGESRPQRRDGPRWEATNLRHRPSPPVAGTTYPNRARSRMQLPIPGCPPDCNIIQPA